MQNLVGGWNRHLSIHGTHKEIDGASKANAHHFWYMTYEQLITQVEFDLIKNNKCWAAGAVWERQGSTEGALVLSRLICTTCGLFSKRGIFCAAWER